MIFHYTLNHYTNITRYTLHSTQKLGNNIFYNLQTKLALIIIFFLLLFILNPAYGLDIGSSAYELGLISFLNGGGSASSANNNAEIIALGEGVATLEESLSGNFRLINGINLFLSLQKFPQWWPIISDLRAKEGSLGNFIPPATWQRNNTPYFYWEVNEQFSWMIEGLSVSLDVLPDFVVDITEPNYQFSQDGIASGKHTFFVIPFVSGVGWNQESLLSFEIWVDVDEPLINQINPPAGYITSNSLAAVSCYLFDEHSGIDTTLTALSLNNQNVLFNYYSEKQSLEFKPDSPLAEGKNTVLLKAFDKAGNFAVKGWEFIVDTQAPYGSILINGGADTSNSAYCAIGIEAVDSVSGIKSIYLSNDGVFDTEMNHPYSYSPLITNWLLSEPDVNGLKSVYAKFQDFAGNFSEVYKDQINLELRTPDTRIISGPAVATESQDAAFIYEASKSGCLFSYKLDDASWSGWMSSNKANFSGLTSGNHYFYVKSGFDLNGDGQITIDEEDATPSQWVWAIKPEGAVEKMKEKILFWRR